MELLIVLVVVVLLVAAGVALSSAAARSAARWRALMRDLVASLDARGRELVWVVDGRHIRLETALAPSGISYHAAARALGRGPLLALLDELAASATADRLSARLDTPGLGTPTLRARLRSFFALADALEALPLAEAMARAFVELPSELDAGQRLAAFEALLRWHPNAREVLGVCQTQARHGGDPHIAERARAHLALIARPFRNTA
ncbi:MAG: hypothetical protein IT385_12260 [Deltaproteobacteria bacterium]|nr:hypothetical protein [Deltaproteobacteria bacterium]